jgi:subtilisin family serine protease
MAIRFPGRQAPVGKFPLPGGYTTDLTPPTVVTFSPGDGVGGVLVGSNMVLTFSESIQRGAGVIAIHSGSADGPVVESFDASSSLNLLFSGNSLTIDPAGNLSSGMHYYVTFGAGTVKDMAGNSYAGTTTYDFTTAPVDYLAPIVTGFTPADGMTGVPIESNIVLTFSELIQRGAGTIAIHSGSFDGTVVESFNVVSSPNLTFSGTTLTINPVSNLQNNTHYYVTFDPGTVRDLAGNGYSGTTVYDFTTVASSSSWDNGSGRGLLNIDTMLENATGRSITDASLFGDGPGLQDWGLNTTQAPDAWNAGYTGKGVIVAVIDTGVNYLHSDLGSNIWKNSGEIAGNGLDDDGNGYVDDTYGWDFVNRDGDAIDDNGHGSSVAGIIAGLNNGFGVTGVAFDALIMPVKVLNSSGGGNDISVADGIYYAVNNGADVINLSLGGGYSARIASALQFAFNNGVLICMASGNAAQSQPVYPALFAQTTGGIAVGAINSSGSLASFSNGVGTLASYDFLVAPGVDIYSTSLDNSYEKMSGTSMATPFVAGAAALLLSAQADFSSNWTVEQLENLITMSASPFFSGATFIAPSLSGRRVVQRVEGIDDHFIRAHHIIEHETELVTLVGIAV